MRLIIFSALVKKLKLVFPRIPNISALRKLWHCIFKNLFFIRKRKVFYGADGSNKSLFDVINKHKSNEKFLYVCSENQQDNEIVNWLKNNNCEFVTRLYVSHRSNDVKVLLEQKEYDVICFFTPSGVKSLFDNLPKYQTKWNCNRSIWKQYNEGSGRSRLET